MELARKTFFVALALTTWAQFMEAIKPVYDRTYIGRASRGYLPNAGTPVDTLRLDGVDGWTAHPLALLALPALATLFLFNINFGPAWMRFRYWIACGLLALCLIPVGISVDPGASREWGNGGMVAILAIAVAVVSALLRKKEA